MTTKASPISGPALDRFDLEAPLAKAQTAPAEPAPKPAAQTARPARRRPLSRFTKSEDSPGFYLSFSDLMCLLLVFFVLIFSLTDVGASVDSPQPGKAKASQLQVRLDLPDFDPFADGLPKQREAVPQSSTPAARAERDPLLGAQPLAASHRPRPRRAEDLVLDRSLLALITSAKPVPARVMPGKETNLSDILEQVHRDVKEQELPGMEMAKSNGALVLSLPEDITFDLARAEIKPSMRPVLSRLAAILASRNGYRVLVTGHTDNVPISNQRFADNWDLSAARAAAVGRALLSQGLDQGRLTIRGMADQSPRVDNSTAQNRARNRRVEIELKPQV